MNKADGADSAGGAGGAVGAAGVGGAAGAVGAGGVGGAGGVALWTCAALPSVHHNAKPALTIARTLTLAPT